MSPGPDGPGHSLPSGDSGAGADVTEVYKAVRAHELMLNEAASALERSVVPPLLTLNGGAAVAFLTLLGALGEDAALSVDVAWARAAIGCWMVGLLLAAIAAWVGAVRQAAINAGHRMMREELEHRLFPGVAAVVEPEPLSRTKRAARRRISRLRATRAAGCQRMLWMASVFAFVAGGALATIAVVSVA